MSLEQLHAEMLEYHLRVEEVLSGMDRAITDLSNRLARIEASKSAASISKASSRDSNLQTEIDDLKGRIGALGVAVASLMSERD